MQEPPHDMEAEMSLLGAMMLDPNCIPDVQEVFGDMNPLYYPPHRDIFIVLCDMHQQTGTFDIVMMEDALRKADCMDEVGGRDYLIDLINSVASSANVKYYARIIVEKHRLRMLVVAAFDLGRGANDCEADPDDLLQSHEQTLVDVRDSSSRRGAIALDVVSDAVIEEVLAGECRPGIGTGFPCIDALIGGLYGGQLSVLAARPSVGKSALAAQVAIYAANKGIPVMFFALEMSAESVTRRLISVMDDIPPGLLRGRGRVQNEAYLQKLHAVKLPGNMYIDATPGLTAAEVISRSRRAQLQYGIGLIVVDHLCLMKPEGGSNKNTNETASELIGAMQFMARDMDMPVLCLHQMNREIERENAHAKSGDKIGKLPRLIDLRDSGDVEQKADNVFFLHRPIEFADVDTRPNQYNIMFLIAKQRDGELGSAWLQFTANRTKFEDVNLNRVIGEYEEPVKKTPDEEVPF